MTGEKGETAEKEEIGVIDRREANKEKEEETTENKENSQEEEREGAVEAVADEAGEDHARTRETPKPLEQSLKITSSTTRLKTILLEVGEGNNPKEES